MLKSIGAIPLAIKGWSRGYCALFKHVHAASHVLVYVPEFVIVYVLSCVRVRVYVLNCVCVFLHIELYAELRVRAYVSGGPKKQKQLTGNSHSTAFVFLDHAVYICAGCVGLLVFVLGCVNLCVPV